MNTPGKRSNPKTKASCKKAHMKFVKSAKKGGKTVKKAFCRKSHNKVSKK